MVHQAGFGAFARDHVDVPDIANSGGGSIGDDSGVKGGVSKRARASFDIRREAKLQGVVARFIICVGACRGAFQSPVASPEESVVRTAAGGFPCFGESGHQPGNGGLAGNQNRALVFGGIVQMGSAVQNALGVCRVPVGNLPGRAGGRAVLSFRGLQHSGRTDALPPSVCYLASRADARFQGAVARINRLIFAGACRGAFVSPVALALDESIVRTAAGVFARRV